MHVFPQLRKLEEKYADEMIVVGVHSAKFAAEKDYENVRKAVLRYEIEHPVVNDKDFEVWSQYGARAWPTLMFIDPEGKVLGKHEGEFAVADLDSLLSKMIAEYDNNQLVNRTPITLNLEKDKEWERPLSFPGKVLADERSDRLFIADSNHNRIVVTDLRGNALYVVGSGKQGLRDGAFDEAQFHDPQGMALGGDTLFVADTKNHAIRAVDLANQSVRTVAGTGEQARSFHRGGNARFVQLRSPWDVVLEGDSLYIAMAGFHQIWRYDLNTQEVSAFAGNGRERIVDGQLANAELAQPSGIVSDGEKLYFTDSETSAVRSADLNTNGSVNTIVGLHLFEFGDVDGIGDEVRLQHPIGIELHDGVLYIADTYNNKIKRIYPATRGATSFIGVNTPGHEDGAGVFAQFHEPAGISVARGKLYIADTNNHAVRVADLNTQEVSTLEISGL
ncbi:MAG: alkyl hydroperoxide reductase [Chloroflexota bacterium]|nr:alkyl hydroperoxide reductase [Chloroflexota bacterium]